MSWNVKQFLKGLFVIAYRLGWTHCSFVDTFEPNNSFFFWRGQLFCGWNDVSFTLSTPATQRDLVPPLIESCHPHIWWWRFGLLLGIWIFDTTLADTVKQASWKVLSFVSVPAVPALTQYSPYPLFMGSCHCFPHRNHWWEQQPFKEPCRAAGAEGLQACDSLSN